MIYIVKTEIETYFLGEVSKETCIDIVDAANEVYVECLIEDKYDTYKEMDSWRVIKDISINKMLKCEET